MNIGAVFGHRWAKILVLLGAIVFLSSCNVDIRVDVTSDDTGAGTIQVTVDVDAEVVTRVPGLADDIRFDDLVAGGWTIEGPLQVNNGGLRVILRYEFESPTEATQALRQISGPKGPLLDPELKRTIDGRLISTTLDGTLQFVGGLDAFSDPILTSAIGESPWRNATERFAVDNPMDSVTVTLVAHLPGKVKKSTGTEAEGGVTWTAPTDGTAQSVVVGAVAERVDGGFWPVLAKVSGTILGYWLIVVGAVILLVTVLKTGRRRRSSGAPRPPRGPGRQPPGRGPRDGLDPSQSVDPRLPRESRPPLPVDPLLHRPPLQGPGNRRATPDL